jgi:hypothetical protein
MGKTQPKTKAEIKERHEFRKKRKEELNDDDVRWFKDELSSLGRGNDDQEQGQPVHKKQSVVQRRDKG